MDSIVGLQTDLALINAFGAYQNELWDEYKILGRSLEGLESDILKSASAGNEEESFSFLNFSVNKVQDFQYALCTDENGNLFVKEISSYMREHFIYENAQGFYSAYESIKGLLESGEFDMEKIDTALEALKQANTSESVEIQEENKTEAAEEITLKENPLEFIKELQKQGILKLVLKDTNVLSEKSLHLENVVSKRSLQTGTLQTEMEVEWIDTMLFQQYLFQYFGNFKNVKENRGLDYELEYFIGKKASDTENLKAVVNKILLTRQAVNMLYLCSDTEKMAIARSVALGFAAVGLAPAMTEIVKLGVIAAWAYAESILDLRALLAGKKIPFLKNSQSWTLEIDQIANIGKEFLMAKESSEGVSYENYLRILLFFEETQNLAYAAMDVIEAAIQKTDTAFSFDKMVVGTTLEIVYESKTIFLGFQFLPIRFEKNPIFKKSTQFFYAW